MSQSQNQNDIDMQDFVSEDEQEMQPDNGVNAYFLLDLKLPDLKLDVVKNQNQSQTSPVVLERFGFIELLEKIHGRDLRTNNPLLNPAVKRVRWKDRFKKKVRFSTTEINGKRAQLPHCRRAHAQVKAGQLHAPSCRNAAHETVEVLGEHVWQNRVFILDAYMRNAEHSYSRSRETSDSEDEEREGYYRASDGSLEEIGVFDSVELAKQRLKSLTGRDVVLDSRQDNDDEIPGSSHQLFEESLQFDRLQAPRIPAMKLELISGSPLSDEDCLTTASTIRLSDQAYTDSPDIVFESSWPQTSALNTLDTQTNTQTNTQTLDTQPAASAEEETLASNFESTENQFQFEMSETPRFRKLVSHSDYGSENDSDEDSDLDLSNLLDELPSQCTTHSPRKSPLKTSLNLPQSSQINHQSFKPTDSARLRATVKISDGSVMGEMFSSSSTTRSNTFPTPDTKMQHLTQFMFDTPSPHD